MSLARCRCGGFLPRSGARCPSCGVLERPLFSRIGALGGIAGGGAIAFTLMACYGAPPCGDGPNCSVDDDAGHGDANTFDVTVLDAAPESDGEADASSDGQSQDAADAGRQADARVPDAGERDGASGD